MAINKQAKNVIVTISDKYISNSRQLTKIADAVNIESVKKDLSLSSNKKIVSQGNIE